jgi:ATP-dependent exoDNAse (exonuclease V) alpha subunit
VADALNDQELGRIATVSRTYVGEVSGKFAVEEVKFPSPLRLSLKVGAQVMFTKNDEKRRWVNGTLGRVVELADKVIRVEIGEGIAPVICDVKPVDWETFKYEYDETEKRVMSVSMGSYRQFPLMLAWAVTIHKSQGKTLAMVRVDLGQGAFDYGQVYVALSRCRSLEDIYLVRPVRWTDIKCDPIIKRFYETLSPR